MLIVLSRLLRVLGLFLFFLVVMPSTFLAALATRVFMSGTQQRQEEDERKEAMRPFLERLVAEGGASWCEKCDGTGSVWATVEYSSARFELYCTDCDSRGVVNIDDAIVHRLQQQD